VAASLGKRPEVGQDGIVDLPPGKIAAIATYLEMHAPPEPRPAPAHPGMFALIGGDIPRYRALYKAIGEPWLWFSRARLSDMRLRAILDDPRVEAFAFHAEGRDLGLIELDFRIAGQCELSFLGLVPGAIGRGLGRVLIQEAIGRAFAKPIERLWLHTCTLDHPAALPFYMAAGLRPYRRAIEIAEDPRLTGELPRDAAPQLPIV
jgi:GNAT superfamily N-acetyltransferase